MNREMPSVMRPALFLDRDGVINVDHGHVYRKEDFDFIPGIFDLVSRANAAGWLVVIVTNQAGIAKNYYSEADFRLLMKWVCQQFAQRGAHIDGVYHCPHHPEFGPEETRNCNCRKPNPGMLLSAAADLNIDLRQSVLIGDKQSDLQAAQEAGVLRSYLFETDSHHKNVNLFAKRNFSF